MTLRRRITQAATQIDREYPSVDQQAGAVADEERDRRIHQLLNLCVSGHATEEELQRGRGLQYVLHRAQARAMGSSS